MGFVLRAASQSQSATRRRPLNAMSSKAQQRPFGAWSTHQQSQQTSLFCFLCVVEPVELQFFLGGSNANSWTVRGSNYGPPVPDAPTLPILHPAKILCRYPNVRPSVTFTAPPRDYLSELRQTLPALARHVQPFFPRSLRAHADDQSSTAVESF